MCRQADRIKTSSRKSKKFGRSIQVRCDAGTNNKKKQTATRVWPIWIWLLFAKQQFAAKLWETKEKWKVLENEGRELRQLKKDVVSHRLCQAMLLPSFMRTTHSRSFKNFKRQDFISEALHQKAKVETNKTVWGTWSCGIMYNSQSVLHSKQLRFNWGCGNLWTRLLKSTGNLFPFLVCLSFCLIVFHTVLTCCVGNSKDNQSSNSASQYIPKELKAGNSRDFCIPMFAAVLSIIA